MELGTGVSVSVSVSVRMRVKVKVRIRAQRSGVEGKVCVSVKARAAVSQTIKTLRTCSRFWAKADTPTLAMWCNLNPNRSHDSPSP